MAKLDKVTQILPRVGARRPATKKFGKTIDGIGSIEDAIHETEGHNMFGRILRVIHGTKELRHLLVEGDRLHEVRMLLAIIENIRRREDQIEGENIHGKDELTHCALIIGLCHLATSFKAVGSPPLEEEPNDTEEDDLVALLETDGVAAEFVL